MSESNNSAPNNTNNNGHDELIPWTLARHAKIDALAECLASLIQWTPADEANVDAWAAVLAVTH